MSKEGLVRSMRVNLTASYSIRFGLNLEVTGVRSKPSLGLGKYIDTVIHYDEICVYIQYNHIDDRCIICICLHSYV